MRFAKLALGGPLSCVSLLFACSGSTGPGQHGTDSSVGGSNASAGGSATSGGSGGNTANGGSSVAGGSAGTSTDGGSTAGGSTAGGAGSGAVGGSDTFPEPNAGNCDNLPAAGTWEHITPAGGDFTSAFAVDPFDQAVIWLGGSAGINKSTDCGATWELVSTGENGPGLADSSLWSIAADHVDQGTLYVIGGYGALSLWKSTNSGVDWTNLFPADSEYALHAGYTFANNISMDPTNHLHLAVATHGNCAAPYDPNCNAESFDGGETWELTVAPDLWPEGGGLFVLNQTSWLWSSPFGGIWRTTNNGDSFDKVREGYGGNGEFTTRPLVKASDGAYYLTSIQGVLRSTDDGASWTQVKPDGKWVGQAMSDTKLFIADQWSNTFAWASIDDPATWTSFDPPDGLPSDAGAPMMGYDEVHHILYASTWPHGFWRIVIE